MSEYIENRAVTCGVCGAYPVYGQENAIETQDKTLVECRWICGQCGNLVRVDEKAIDKNEEK